MLSSVRRAAGKPEYAIAAVLFLLLTVSLVALKMIRVDEMRGDTAIFSQVAENIAYRGVPVSEVFANTRDYQTSGILTKPASEIATDPLAPPAQNERNILNLHAYYIFYPIAVLVRFIPVRAVLLSLDVLAFTGLLLLAYAVLRDKRVPVAAACLFLVLIVSHPAWADSLLYGQFYPDRLFLFAGFLCMCAVTRPGVARWVQIASALLCLLIGERAASVAGLFLLAYSILYWKSIGRERLFKFALGAALLGIGFLILKLQISDTDYGTFLPGNVAQIVAYLRDPAFVGKLEVFALANLPFILLALFVPRAAAIAILLMLPNAFGNIGGAEKTGWATHYHSYYFPALVWASAAGYAYAYERFRQWRGALVYALAALCIALLSALDPALATPAYSPSNISGNFILEFPRQAATYFGPAGSALVAASHEVRNSVPPGTTVSMPEITMPFLFEDRTVRVLPVDIDKADYAVLQYTQAPGQAVVYSGPISFLGPDEQAQVNDVVISRMKKDGFDFANAKLIPEFAVAIVHHRR